MIVSPTTGESNGKENGKCNGNWWNKGFKALKLSYHNKGI